MLLRLIRPLHVMLFTGYVLLVGCSTGMRMKMDAAWERVDPMGHRKIHQERDIPRGLSTGMRLPKDVSY